MCDSDSEEFASADEDFEEIEPDELEEVLGSVKPSDVSSKKPAAKPSSEKSDVDAVSSSSAISTEPNVEPKDGSSKEPNKTDFERTEKAVRDAADREDDKGTEKVTIPKAVQEDPLEKEVQSSRKVERESSSKESSPTQLKPEPEREDCADAPSSGSAKQQLFPTNDSKAVAGTDKLQNTVADNSSEDNNASPTAQLEEPNKPYTPEQAVKPKKLILKPARPQLLEEQPQSKAKGAAVKEEKPSAEAAVEANNSEQPPGEEGWDDFDDDWGDFNVEGSGDGGGGGGGMKKMEPNPGGRLPARAGQPTEGRATAKASFRDVDIDEVEHKLKDFMQHKDDPPLASVLDRLSSNEEHGKAASGSAGQSSWGGWKPSWGGAAVSFLSTASKSVASITTNITQVIESGIGVPNPEEMARRQAEMEAKLKAEGYLREEEEEEGDEVDPTRAASSSKASEDRFGFDQLVSGVTQISSKVITGGLDTLEGIGKKTMTILQENDPGLLNKRKLLGLQPNDGVILSQVLREAKAKTEERERNLKQIQKHQYKRKLHFEALFDDYHGLVHLEALEMLSKQASLRLESLMGPLTGKALDDLQETMAEVKELCELPEMDHDDESDGRHTADELEAKLKEAIVDLDPSVKVDFSEIVHSWAEYTAWMNEQPETADDEEGRTAQDIFEKAMHALAQTTALCVLRMHKLAEILLISEHHSTATEADVLVQLTTVFCWHLGGVATRFCSVLTKLKNVSADSSDNALITNIFLEGSNSTSYIQNAFHLFIPILQMGAA